MNAPYDLAFAQAVQRAAAGIRPKSGCDPEVAGEPAAALLRAGAALGAGERELLAQMAMGALRKVRQSPGESALARALREAGAAWRGGKGADPGTEGAALASLLRGGAELRPGERELLAQMITGEWRRGSSRPPLGAGHPRVVEVVTALRAIGGKRTAAVAEIAARFDITTRTVEAYEAMVRERENLTPFLRSKPSS